MIRETRRVSLAFAVRPDDILTGRPAWPLDGSLRIISCDGLSHAQPKDDGYFIFTGTRPGNIRAASGMYEDFSLSLHDCSDNVLRVFMVPRKPAGRRVLLNLKSGECAHIGFYGKKTGYALLPETAAGSLEITLNKDDYADLTGLFHILIYGDEPACAVYISNNLGYGRYRLSEPFPAAHPIRGTRLLPLYRVVGNGGNLHIPVPDESLGAYLLRGGDIKKISIEGCDS